METFIHNGKQHRVSPRPKRKGTAMEKKLTVWQAACIITGYGVGSGIMALPYLTTRAGIGMAVLLLVLAFLFSYGMHMMLAELAMGAGRGCQVVGIFKHFLLRGRFAKPLTLFAAVLVAFVLIFNLAAYVAGGAEVLEAAGLPPLVAELLFYVVAAAVVFFGLKVLGISESIAIDGIIVIVLILAAGSISHFGNGTLSWPTGSGVELLAFFGMAMMAFVAFFSVPQAVEGLDHDPAKVRKAILIGLGLNAAFMVVIVSCSLLASTEVTELAIVGWSAGIGLWAQVLGSAFTLLAMLTTYWSISLALSDIIEEQFRWNKRICWLIATLPSLLIVVFNFGSFLDIMRTAAGAIAILISFLVVPAFRRCRRENGPLLLPKPLASTPVQILVVVAFLLMAAGNLVGI